MENVTFEDIEIEIKKIPIENLSEVYLIIKGYSQKTQIKSKSQTYPEKRMTLESLDGCIQAEDLNEYRVLKNKKGPIITDYATTIDRDLIEDYAGDLEGNE